MFISKRIISPTRSIIYEGKRFSEILKSEVCTNEFSVQNLRESHETIQRLTSQLQEMQTRMNSMNDSGEVESNNGSSQPAVVASPRSMLSRDKRLPTSHMEYVGTTGKRFWVINCLRLIHTEIIINKFIIVRHQVLQDRFQCMSVQGHLLQEVKNEIGAQFQCRYLQEGRRP